MTSRVADSTLNLARIALAEAQQEQISGTRIVTVQSALSAAENDLTKVPDYDALQKSIQDA